MDRFRKIKRSYLAPTDPDRPRMKTWHKVMIGVLVAIIMFVIGFVSGFFGRSIPDPVVCPPEKQCPKQVPCPEPAPCPKAVPCPEPQCPEQVPCPLCPSNLVETKCPVCPPAMVPLTDAPSSNLMVEADNAIASTPVAPTANSGGDPNCDAWAARGECIKNPNYMLSNCELSCYNQRA